MNLPPHVRSPPAFAPLLERKKREGKGFFAYSKRLMPIKTPIYGKMDYYSSSSTLTIIDNLPTLEARKLWVHVDVFWVSSQTNYNNNKCIKNINTLEFFSPLCYYPSPVFSLLSMEISQDNLSGAHEVAGESSVPRVPVRCRTLGALFSASAQDLRSYDIRKETLDENSPRGVIEACRKDVEPENVEPENVEPGKVEPEQDSPTKVQAPCIPTKSLSRWRKLVKLWKKKSVKHLSNITSIHKISNKMGINGGENESEPCVSANICKMKASWKIFSAYELQKATNNFSTENLIGRGGFAEVYKGCLKGGQLVAVKRLTRGTHEERVNSFLSELGVIAHVDHPNTAKLIGYGVEKGLYIVLQLSSLGSLGSLLHGSNEKVDWSTRYKIAVGTADGLLYLHEGCQRRIIHRDIKADNILLTENYEPQICDFGLGKWLPRQWTHHNVSKFEGTFGYFAPEYFMHGIVDEKTDVYAFGVILLELITGRKALDSEQRSIILWAKPLLDEHDLVNLVDPILGGDYNEEEMDRMVLTAALCVQQTPVLRPRMNQVIILLRGDDYQPQSSRGNQTRMQRTYSEELLDAKEYNSTKQLNELQRHRQLAFDSEIS